MQNICGYNELHPEPTNQGVPTIKITGGIGFCKTLEYLFSDFLGTAPKIERMGKLKRVHALANPSKSYIDEKGQVFSYINGLGFRFCYFTI